MELVLREGIERVCSLGKGILRIWLGKRETRQ